MFWRLHEPAHTTAVTAGRLLWVINRIYRPEHFQSASPESGPIRCGKGLPLAGQAQACFAPRSAKVAANFEVSKATKASL
jgi:hypothetical protein